MVVAEIVTASVAVFFAISLIMLSGVSDQVMQRESVMCGYKINAGGRLKAFAVEDMLRSCQPVGQLSGFAKISAPESAGIITKSVIPFMPVGRKISELVAVRTEIPRFRNQFHFGKHRIVAQ